MFNIVAKMDRKVSDGNYGSSTLGVILTQEGLELKNAEEVAKAADELFRLAKEAVDRQVGGNGTAPVAKAPAPQPAPSNGNGAHGNGHGTVSAGNGRGNGTGNGRRPYGRPATEPSYKQKALLKRLCTERSLPPETIRQICERVAGCRLEQLDRKGFSLLLQNLMSEEVAR